MGIADLFRPKYRHSDVRVRTEAVRALTSDDAAILVTVARTDRDIGVRRLAIERIDAADVLAELAAGESERSLRDLAGERAAQLWVQTACGDDAEAAGAALGGLVKLGDQHALVDVAVKAALPPIRKRAFGELRDPRALAELAKRDAPHDLRLAAIARIDDGDVLRAVAIDTTHKEVGLAAVDKLDDVDRLDNVAQKAKNKAVRQRARKIVAEIGEAEHAKKPGTPDDVKRRRAEQAQLVREVEAVADTFDFDKAAPLVRAAEAAWQQLGGEPDERFARATQRFWKRKEVYGQQARTADELRAIEREAQREKARAAAERAAKVPDEVEPKPAAPLDDHQRAEEVARREDRERRRLEDDARRAAQLAERDARQKEDAERGTAIAASLSALCADMESLAETKDGRAIDRLLQQAAQAVEQIGRVPSAEREGLSNRYTAARGKLVAKVGELREAEDWARFANVPKAEALIQTAKQMAAAPTTPDLGNRLRQLQALWKEVGPMPQRRSKELWEQFKAACDQVYDQVKGLRAVESEKFVEVTQVKHELIAAAEALADSSDWAKAADQLKALQAKWKDSGHLPRKQGDELWQRFRAACDRFFERRKPVLDAEHAEQAQNLAAKQALIARARAVADAAPGDGGWGKAIADIKDLQRQWQDIGFVPRRDADAVYRGFRGACDALFEKRDASRDTEANAHRAALDAVRAEIAAVAASPGDDVVARALAARAKARELGGHELAGAVDEMVRHVIASRPDQARGTELDPVAARVRRDKLIAKAAELLPKPAPAVSAAAAPVDIAAQLAQAMRSNAFGELRFSGRDPVEVVDELRGQWAEAGPILDDEDRAQLARFDELCKGAVAKAGSPAADDDPPPPTERRRREGRRRERGPARTEPAEAVPVSAHDAITAPAHIPFAPLEAPTLPPPAAPTRAKSITVLPPMDELDTGWDTPDDDPTAKPATGEPRPD